VSASDDAPPRQIGSKAEGTMAVWSDDSQRIALADGIDATEVTIVGLDGRREHVADAGDLLQDGWDLPDFFERPRVSASESAKHRGDFDVYIADAGGGNRRQLTDSPENEQEPALSPDGEAIAFMRNERELWLMDADGSDQRLLSSDFKSVGVPQPLAWSPDGRFIVWDRFGELKIVEVATGETFAPVSVGAGCYAYFVSWTPDSREIYVRTHCDFDGL
jgi:dipeptidyl aminopeptidase/acylaminoacyl peptidase